MPVTRSAVALRALVQNQAFDLRTLDPVGFRAWLGRLLVRWERDTVFRQRVTIRDLRRAHPELRAREQACQVAAAADAATPVAARLRELQRAAAGAQKAVAGLTETLARAVGDGRPRLSAKLADHRQRLQVLAAEQAELERGSPERRALMAAEAALRAVRAATGLDRTEAELAKLLAARGRRSTATGVTFEEVAAAVIDRELVPELAAGGGVRVVRRVRLGAGAEFDALVVREPRGGGVVEVLAAVEAKRDANGLAHGFLRRQADLAWLTGDAGTYDPAAHRTRAFPTGHFDSSVEVPVPGGAVRLGPGSFAGFRREPGAGWFLGGLYLATRPGPLWGLPPAALARVASWVAGDEDFEPDNGTYLAGLYRRCVALAGPVEAPDVLRLYAASDARGRKVILVEGDPPRSPAG